MHDQQFLNEYFASNWSGSTEDYIYSSYAVLRRFDPLSDHVLDVGCGSNPFKGKITNLVGIDPANPAADIITTIEEYEPDRQFDIAICFGSINFGSKDIIAKQIAKINQCLKPSARVFWRLNPGLQDHPSELCQQIDFYPWTLDTLWEFATTYKFCQVNCHWDTNGKHKRIYAEWWRY